MRSSLYLTFLYTTLCYSCNFGAGVKHVKRSSNSKLWYSRKLDHNGINQNSNLKLLTNIGDEHRFKTVLNPILTVRVPDTDGHTRVRKFILQQMNALGWTTEEDTFLHQTIIGVKRFTNIIATLNPAASRRLVIACHYDSKLTPTGFLGAIDSAVPCAMMINLAQTMKDYLNRHDPRTDDLTLQFIFFDGEEAFVEWSDTDSLYGSRYMAGNLSTTPYPPQNVQGTTHLDRMDLFILLDLIGTIDTQFYSMFSKTDRWFNRLKDYESDMRSLVLLNRRQSNIFKGRRAFGARVEDDHIPFLKRDVPILHLISVPFPKVWHKITDNEKSLHYETIQDMNSILRVFVADYLKLNL